MRSYRIKDLRNLGINGLRTYRIKEQHLKVFPGGTKKGDGEATTKRMYEHFVTVTTVLQRKQEGTSPFGPLSLRSDQRGNIFRNIARATTKNLTLSVPLLRPGPHAPPEQIDVVEG